MFTPEMARKQYIKRAINSVNVNTALGEIETQFCQNGPTFLAGEYSAMLETWLNKEERDVLKETLKEWGWHSIKITELYTNNQLIVYAKGA